MRAQGKPGASAAPIASYANRKAYERSHYRSAKSPAFPAQWFTAYPRALPGVHDLVSHRHQLDSSSNGLSTSPGVPGPHAFAVRGRIARLAIRPRPSHPASRFVTMRIRPSYRGGTAQIIRIDLRKAEEDYFSIKRKYSLTRRANQCVARAPAPSPEDRRHEPAGPASMEIRRP